MLVVAAAGCAAPAAGAGLGGVRLTSGVPEASLFVDDELLGTVADYEGLSIRLPPGTHRIVLDHPDYHPEEIEVTVSEGMATAVTLEMRRRDHAPGDDDHVLP